MEGAGSVSVEVLDAVFATMTVAPGRHITVFSQVQVA